VNEFFIFVLNAWYNSEQVMMFLCFAVRLTRVGATSS